MKKLKMNLFALIAVAIAAVTMSFQLASSSEVFHYTDAENPGVFSDPANWSPGGSPAPCNTGESFPCEITVENEQDLTDQLDGKNNQQVLDIADSMRD